jgi:hypothetical protein
MIMTRSHIIYRAFARALALVALSACALLAAGCSSAQRFNDAVRIKPQKEAAYQRTPVTNEPRDGRTLRGTVIEVQIAPRPTSPEMIDTTFLFLDAKLPDKEKSYERIPLDDVERVSALFSLPPDTLYNNVNVVESFNTTEQIPTLRRVPVRDYTPYLAKRSAGDSSAASPKEDCGCLPLDLSIPFPDLECAHRDYAWYFVELRGVYSTYNDQPTRTTEQGKDAYLAEVAAGFRFGAADEWGVGVLYSSGIGSYDSYTSALVRRPLVLLHARYQTPGPVTNFLGICMKPFVYGEFGATIDKATVNLMKLNLSSTTECGECGEMINDLNASGELGNLDLSMPLSFGLGLGVDVPVASFMDVSTDIGWRSIGIGENAQLGGWVVPSLRRLNTFFFRAGLTF